MSERDPEIFNGDGLHHKIALPSGHELNLETNGGLSVTDRTKSYGQPILDVSVGGYDGFVHLGREEVVELVAALQKWLEETK